MWKSLERRRRRTALPDEARPPGIPFPPVVSRPLDPLSRLSPPRTADPAGSFRPGRPRSGLPPSASPQPRGTPPRTIHRPPTSPSGQPWLPRGRTAPVTSSGMKRSFRPMPRRSRKTGPDSCTSSRKFLGRRCFKLPGDLFAPRNLSARDRQTGMMFLHPGTEAPSILPLHDRRSLVYHHSATAPPPGGPRTLDDHAKQASRPDLRGTSDTNVPFEAFRSLLRDLGFDERIKGSHHIFSKEGVAEILNLQPKGSKAKPYQVQQVRRVILKYHLAGDADD